MKALLILALCVALISADYTPNWSSCSGSDDPWQPTTITLAKEPKLNENDSMHACGNVQDDVTVGSFKLGVKAAGVIIYTTTVQLTQQEILPGSQYCFDYNVYIPIIARGTFELDFELQDNTNAGIGCFTVQLSLKNQLPHH